jgi:hypothetical protein
MKGVLQHFKPPVRPKVADFIGDRAIEISMAFEEDEFDKFPGGPKSAVKYNGMKQYDGDALIPQKYLVNPAGIDRTVCEYLVKAYGLIGHYQQGPDAYEGVIESWLNSNHLPERRAGVIIAGESVTSKYVNRLEAPS